MKKILFCILILLLCIGAFFLFRSFPRTSSTVYLPTEEVAIRVGSAIAEAAYPRDAYPELYENRTWGCFYEADGNIWRVFTYREGWLGGGVEIHLNKKKCVKN